MIVTSLFVLLFTVSIAEYFGLNIVTAMNFCNSKLGKLKISIVVFLVFVFILLLINLMKKIRYNVIDKKWYDFNVLLELFIILLVLGIVITVKVSNISIKNTVVIQLINFCFSTGIGLIIGGFVSTLLKMYNNLRKKEYEEIVYMILIQIKKLQENQIERKRRMEMSKEMFIISKYFFDEQKKSYSCTVMGEIGYLFLNTSEWIKIPYSSTQKYIQDLYITVFNALVLYQYEKIQIPDIIVRKEKSQINVHLIEYIFDMIMNTAFGNILSFKKPPDTKSR